MRLLLAEDDRTIREYVAQGLRESGYAVDVAADGLDAELAASTGVYDVIILDIGMPGRSGLEICRRLKSEANVHAGVLMLTARDTVDDRVVGLDAGADDYLTKPFAFVELQARIRALLRRGGGAPAVLRIGDVELDPASRRVIRAGKERSLTAKEFALLEYLMRNAGRVLSKTQIADHVWDTELESESNFIEVLVYGLRKRLDAPGPTGLIETVRGVGYRFNAMASPP